MSKDDLTIKVRGVVPVEVTVELHGVTRSTSLAHVLGKVKERALQHISRELQSKGSTIAIVGAPKLELTIPVETLEELGSDIPQPSSGRTVT